jgi:hypothetical protein
MKPNNFLWVILGLAILGIFFAGFFCHAAIYKPKPVKAEIVKVEIPDQRVFNYVRDHLKPEFPYPILTPGTPLNPKPCTTWADSTTPIWKFPVENHEILDSGIVLVNGKPASFKGSLQVGVKGLLDYTHLDLFPMTYIDASGNQPMPAGPSNWRGLLYVGLGAPIPLDTIQGETGLFLFYKRLGIYGRAELRPNYELNTLRIKYRVFATIRIF